MASPEQAGKTRRNADEHQQHFSFQSDGRFATDAMPALDFTSGGQTVRMPVRLRGRTWVLRRRDRLLLAGWERQRGRLPLAQHEHRILLVPVLSKPFLGAFALGGGGARHSSSALHPDHAVDKGSPMPARLKVGSVPRHAWIGGFMPRAAPARRADVARGAIGGFIGIVVAALAAAVTFPDHEALPFIVAPIGASAVLLLAAPASPLAQPWPLMGGNIISSLVGVAAGKLFDRPALAAAAAVGVAITVMLAARCLHPPGGACALFAAVGAPAIKDFGFKFAIWPVGINSLFLLIVAVAVNNLTGRQYPHVPVSPPSDATDRPPGGLQHEDIEAAIERLDAGLDVMPADVVALIKEAEDHALDRRLGQLRCSAVMTRDVITLHPTDSIYRARLLMNQHRVKALPVIDMERHVIGIVTVFDLFNLDVADLAPATSVMSSPVTTVHEDEFVADLVRVMTGAGLRALPVVDDEGRLVGIVSRTELIAVLHRALVEAGA
jgi:CBS domain-containing membrane protein